MIDFDFNVNNFVLDICESTERFSLCGGVMRLQELIIPKIGDSVRFMSGIGDFSSCCVLLRISEQTNIHSIVLSTLRCGKKEVDALEDLQIPIEQFCVMNSESVYDWYINTFKKITGTNIIHDTRDGN